MNDDRPACIVCGQPGTTIGDLCRGHLLLAQLVNPSPDVRFLRAEITRLVVDSMTETSADMALSSLVGGLTAWMGTEHRDRMHDAWSDALDRWHGAPVEVDR